MRHLFYRMPASCHDHGFRRVILTTDYWRLHFEKSNQRKSRRIPWRPAQQGRCHIGLSDHPANDDCGSIVRDVRRRRAGCTVHQGGKRAFGHGRPDRCGHGGGAHLYGHQRQRAASDARGPALDCRGSAAHRHGHRQPGRQRRMEHLGRADRFPGPAGYGMDSDFLRIQPGAAGRGHHGLQTGRESDAAGHDRL